MIVSYGKEVYKVLSSEQEQIIIDQLSKENASEFVKKLIRSYAVSVENISELLSYIPELAEKQLTIKETVIHQYSWATDLLITDRYFHPHKYKKNDECNQFCTLLYTCMVHFKNGNADGQSESCKQFFNEFIEVLKAKKEFDYTNEEDWEWVYNTAICDDWLESVIRQNIDDKFIKPKNKNYTGNRI